MTKQILACSVFFFAVSNAYANHHMSCTKDGKTVNVAGKTDDDKKAACEKDGGTWAESAKKADKKEEAKKEKGGGGGW